MKPITPTLRLEKRLLMIALAIACMPLFAALASAQQAVPQGFTDPAQIDRAVADFAGAEIGEDGGARVPADRRLRLAQCAMPLAVSWHGRSRSIVAVACPGPQPWRIFISMRAPEQAPQSQVVVARGDPITVVVRGRGFTVQQSGEAIDAGAVGDWIAIRTDRQSDPIRARIERPGLAVIPVS